LVNSSGDYFAQQSEDQLLAREANIGNFPLRSTTTQTSKLTLSDFKNGNKYSKYSPEYREFDIMRSVRIILLNDVGGMGYYPDSSTITYSKIYEEQRAADNQALESYNKIFIEELADEFRNLNSRYNSKLYQPAQKLSEFTLFGLIPNILSEICTFFNNCDNQISLSHQTKLLATLYQLPNKNPSKTQNI
jgi:hypothetical protein